MPFSPQLWAKAGGDKEIARPTKFALQRKQGVVIVREKNSFRKFRPQCAKDEKLVENIAPDNTDRLDEFLRCCA